MNNTIQPEKILKELADLWVTLAKDDEQQGQEGGVLRACAMTLLAAINETEDPADVGETIALLMREHPSRAIVVRLRDCAERVLEARVFAQCWKPFGHKKQICCEQIEIITSEKALDDLPSVALPLTVPDLPIILWCRSKRLYALPEFPALAAVANKIILDSQALGSIEPVRTSPQMVADLSWTRITRWREIVSRAVESQSLQDRLKSEVQVVISHPGAKPCCEAEYFGAWIASIVKGALVELDPSEQPALAGISAVRIQAPGIHLQLRAEHNAVEVDFNGQVSRSVFPPLTDYSLLQEELSIPGRDPVFEAALTALT